MSARSYLSIGDVLTLLRQEFPDITISKIRFLESQGLVNPERTPSGYRKFYEQDVERLRWVLRQQREHFLPLKVIKDRLDDGSGAIAPATGSTEAAHHESAPTAHSRIGDPVLVGQRRGAEAQGRSPSVGAHPAGEAPLSLVGENSGLPGIRPSDELVSDAAAEAPLPSGPATPSRPPGRSASASHRRGVDRTPLLELVDDTVAPGSPVATSDPTPHSGDGVAAGTGTAVTGSAVVGTGTSGSAATRRAKPATVARTESGEATRGAKGGGRATPPTPTPPRPPTPPDPPGPGKRPPGGDGISLSAEELAAASDLNLTVVRELQEYGLLVAVSVAGVEHFDEEALTVATAAAGFTRFGIEPRHLRLYKNAAEREAGFVEQVVLPLVRQRNPEARARAHETAEELTQLGQQLRGSLLRTALGNLLNG